MARTINISAGCLDPLQTDDAKWQQLRHQCGDDDKAIRDAIGYLSLWNWSGYPHVDIVLMGREGDMELCAYYRKEPGGKAGYVIGAVWHGDHFGFHS